MLSSKYYSGLAMLLLMAACTSAPEKQESTETKPPVKQIAEAPQVNADSIFSYVAQQVNFGPRIPGTKNHDACAEWLKLKLDSYIPGTIIQNGTAATFDRKKFTLKNIIAAYKPELKKRILLCAHWDTRPFADRDEGPNKNKQFDGANDGGSGVGVLIEIARLLSIHQPEIGVDIILFDLEDYGQPDESNYPQMNESWCLGSQYWAQNLHVPDYYAQFGILLDMVGARGAVFPKEGTSQKYAAGVVDKVWKLAERMGYSSYFTNAVSGMTTDDHVYVMRYANIPCINIVHYNVMAGDYFPHHHRITDNLENIDPAVLKMVAQVVLQVVYDEI